MPSQNNSELTQAHVRTFVDLLEQGVEAWVKAGKLLVQMLERNPNTYVIILKECPRLSISLLLTFERIGRNELHPNLVLDTSIGAKQLLSLPYPLQDKYYKETIPVVVALDGKRQPVIQRKLYHQINKEEARRVFAFGKLRTVEEQAAMIPAQKKGTGRVVPTEHSKFSSIGCFRLSLDKQGKPVVLKADAIDAPSIIEIKVTGDGGIGSNIFEILADKNLIPEAPENGEADKSDALPASIQNQIDELTRRRAEMVAKLKTASDKEKPKLEAGIRELNRKIESVKSIA